MQNGQLTMQVMDLVQELLMIDNSPCQIQTKMDNVILSEMKNKVALVPRSLAERMGIKESETVKIIDGPIQFQELTSRRKNRLSSTKRRRER